DVIQSEVPSSCSLWRRAEQGVFYAPAQAHFRCPVGAMVMGFELPQPVADELGQLVSSMCDCGYIASDEPAHIPTIPFKPKGIVYGPLDAFPLRADAVVCWLSPRQAMIWNEACGEARWTVMSLRPLPVDRPVPPYRPASTRTGRFCHSAAWGCAP